MILHFPRHSGGFRKQNPLTHSAGCVMVSIHSGDEGHYLVEAGWAFLQVICQPSEVWQGGMHPLCKRKPFPIHMEKGFLHVSEQLSRTR